MHGIPMKILWPRLMNRGTYLPVLFTHVKYLNVYEQDQRKDNWLISLTNLLKHALQEILYNVLL